MKRTLIHAHDIIKHKFGIDISTDPGVQAWRIPFEIGQLAYDARTAAGLTEQQLGEKIGVTAEAIHQLEEADYDGDALRLLERVAGALGKKVDIQLSGAEVVAK